MREGLLVEVPDEHALARAITQLRAQGYRELEAFTPFPSEEVTEAMELPRSRLPLLVLLGAIAGGTLAYLIMWGTNVVDYPLNIGGRELHAWPAFIPITFETAVLFGGLAAFFGFFALSRLPRPWQPVFEVSAFDRVTSDGYFLAVWPRDYEDAERARRELEAFSPICVLSIPGPREEVA